MWASGYGRIMLEMGVLSVVGSTIKSSKHASTHLPTLVPIIQFHAVMV